MSPEIEEQMEVDELEHVDNETDPKIELYEVWKKRVLEKARRELQELENSKKKNDTLRRSPRKTPQKIAPYKSPVKSNGVRLLFPSCNLK